MHFLYTVVVVEEVGSDLVRGLTKLTIELERQPFTCSTKHSLTESMVLRATLAKSLCRSDSFEFETAVITISFSLSRASSWFSCLCVCVCVTNTSTLHGIAIITQNMAPVCFDYDFLCQI